MTDVPEQIAEWTALATLDCGDNSCRFAVEHRGMRTNGGCRCIDLDGGLPHQLNDARTKIKERNAALNAAATACETLLTETREQRERLTRAGADKLLLVERAEKAEARVDEIATECARLGNVCHVQVDEWLAMKARAEKAEAREAALLKTIAEPIAGHSLRSLREKANQLKQTDGEGWAVGELVFRVIDILTSTDSTGQEVSELKTDNKSASNICQCEYCLGDTDDE